MKLTPNEKIVQEITLEGTESHGIKGRSIFSLTNKRLVYRIDTTEENYILPKTNAVNVTYEAIPAKHYLVVIGIMVLFVAFFFGSMSESAATYAYAYFAFFIALCVWVYWPRAYTYFNVIAGSASVNVKVRKSSQLVDFMDVVMREILK